MTHQRTAATIAADSDRPSPTVFLAGPATCLGLGTWFAWQHLRDPQPASHRAAAALILPALAALQLEIWRRSVRARRSTSRGAGPHFLRRRTTNWPGLRSYLRWLFTCAVACYAATLAAGSGPAMFCVFAAAFAASHTIMLAIAVRPASVPATNGRLRRAALRGVGRLAFGLATAAAAGELAIRAIDWQFGGRLAEQHAAEIRKLPAGADYHGRTVNSFGYCDEEFTRERRPETMRVLVLGRLQTIFGIGSDDWLGDLERATSDVEVYNLGLHGAGPRELAGQFAAEAPTFRPDLTMIFLSVDDIAASQAPPHVFDWRGLRLYQWSRRALSPWISPGRIFPDDAAAMDASFERRVQSVLPSLSLCRSPSTPAAENQWQESFDWLDDLYRESRRRETPLVLVLAPSDVQWQQALRQAACRQAGCDPTQVDVEAPQRRFKSFADARQLPVIDLLPHFQAAKPSPGESARRPSARAESSLAAQVLADWLSGEYAMRVATAER